MACGQSVRSIEIVSWHLVPSQGFQGVTARTSQPSRARAFIYESASSGVFTVTTLYSFISADQPAEYLVSISTQLPTVKATSAQYSGSSKTSLPSVVHQS